MTADVVAWLESAEGEAWARERTTWAPRSREEIISEHFVALRRLEQMSGPVDPALDPCGRPAS